MTRGSVHADETHGKVEEVVATVLWLCSDHASFITGATVPIDGGQQAGPKLSRMYRPGQPKGGRVLTR